MPFYNYFCANCEVDWEAMKKISERDDLLSQPCPNCNVQGQVTRPVETPRMVSGVLGITHHMPSDYRQLMKRIKKANRGSTIPDL